jgi:hypothetical protein
VRAVRRGRDLNPRVVPRRACEQPRSCCQRTALERGRSSITLCLKKDFKAGQIPCGPRGLQGDSGETGPQGPQGIQGPRGPSSGFYGLSNVIVGEVPDTEGSIGHLSLPAGKFIAFAKAAFVNPGAAETLVECEIKAIGVPNSSYDRGNLRLTGSTGATYYDAGVLSLTATTYASTISGFDFRCKDNNGLVQFFDERMSAIQVESMQHLP